MKRKILALAVTLLCIVVISACKKKEPEPPAPQMPAPVMPSGQMPPAQMPMGQMPAGPIPQAQAPTGQMPPAQMPPAGMGMTGKTQIVVPESVKGKWSAVKIILEDKITKTKKEFEVKLNSDFKIPDSSLKIHVGEFLPDFRMDGLNLTSGSNEPRNPALSIRVFEGGKQIFPAPGRQWGWLFAKVPSIHPFEHPKYGITLKEGIKKG